MRCRGVLFCIPFCWHQPSGSAAG